MLAPVADGMIVGSAIVKRLSKASRNDSQDDSKALEEVEAYAKTLISALASC